MRSDVIAVRCHAQSLRSFLKQGWEAVALQRVLAGVDTVAPVVHSDIPIAKVGSFIWLVGFEGFDDRAAAI